MRWVWCLLMLLICVHARAETILVISDLHMTENSQDMVPVLQAIRNAAEECDAVLVLGDHANNGKPAEHALVTDCLDSLASQTGVRVYTVPGNHDLNRSFDRASYQEAYAAFGRNTAFSQDPASASCAVMTDLGTCLLLLDTNAVGEDDHVLPDGGISAETQDWLSQVLESVSADVPVLACGHHPILPKAREARTPGAQKTAEILMAYGVRLYLCGHDHGFYTVEENGLREIVVGQPQAYPGMAGCLRVTDAGTEWHMQSLFREEDATFQVMKAASQDLAWRMGSGTLKGTRYENDTEAVQWFTNAFMAYIEERLTEEVCSDLLMDANAQKWREIETRTVVRDWILGLLASPPEPMQTLMIP